MGGGVSVITRLLEYGGIKKRAFLGAPMMLPRVGRRHLPRLVHDLGFTKGAEIGVWKGAYSASFCEMNPYVHMLCVDPWQSYPAWLDTKNSLPQPEAEALMDEAYQVAQARLRPLNTTIVRKFSVDAAAEVPDRSLDFVYIDANHVFDAVTSDLTAWLPKVRLGGFISGHDYRIFKNKPTIHVMAAVQAFTRQHYVDPWFVLAADRTPSFIWEVR